MSQTSTNSKWAVTAEKVEQAVQRIVAVAQPKRLYLFGSYVASPQHHAPADLDVMVVVDDSIGNTRHESTRIRQELADIAMPMDILVVRAGEFESLAAISGLVYREVALHGKVVYDAAA
jgi:predicted nucleotidyltransferase